jgi:peptide/nickel transport system ATP-binding protein
MAKSVPVIQLKNVSFFYPHRLFCFGKRRHGAWVLKNISLEISGGECVGIVGENGSGKSTLARIIGRQQRPQRGKILYGKMENFSRREFCRFVQCIAQSPGEALDPLWTVGGTLGEPLKIHFPHLSRSQMDEKMEELLQNVSLDGSILHRRTHALSGGQRQRVAIARALAVGPRVLICDEVTSALDTPIQWEILNLLNDLRARQKLSILFISHSATAVGQVADRVALMQDGKIIECGSVADICLGSRRHWENTHGAA